MEIDNNSDFSTFQNIIQQKFGLQYEEQADLLIERAIEMSNKKLFHTAINDGKFALDLNFYSSNQTMAPHIIGFLAQIHCEAGMLEKALEYHELGIKLLDNESLDFEDDKELFRKLKERIDSQKFSGGSWEEN